MASRMASESGSSATFILPHVRQPLAQLLHRMGGPFARALAGWVILFGVVEFCPCRTIMDYVPGQSTHPESRNFAISSLLPCRRRSAAGATQAEADVSLQQGLNVTVRLGEVETIEYQRDRALGITVYFNGAKGSASSADLRPEAVRAMVAKACSIAHLHRARRICRAGRCRRHGARYARTRSLSSLGAHAGGGHRNGDGLRGCGHGRRSAPDQLRRRLGVHASRRARVRQHARLPRRLSQHQPQHQLRAAGAGRRRHAARLLVHGGARRHRPRRSGAGRPPCRGARHRPSRRAADQHAQGAGAVRRRCGARASSGTWCRRCAAPASIANRRSCWMRRASRCCRISCRCRSDRTCRAPWPAVPSMSKASPPAIATWCATACCRAMCWAAIRRASSACIPPATPAASTTCW